MNTYLAKKITLALVLASPIYGFTASDVAFAENTGGIIEVDVGGNERNNRYIGEDNPSSSDINIDTVFNSSDNVYYVYGALNHTRDDIDDSIVLSDNKVTINLKNDESNFFDHSIYVAQNRNKEESVSKVENNKLIINSGYLSATSYTAGAIYYGDANKNEIIVNGGYFKDSLMTWTAGQISHEGNASDNVIIINGGSFNISSELKLNVADISDGILKNNKVIIRGTEKEKIDFTNTRSLNIVAAKTDSDTSAFLNKVDINYIEAASVDISAAGWNNSNSWNYAQKANNNELSVNNSVFNSTATIQGISPFMEYSEGIAKINNNRTSIKNSEFNGSNIDLAGVYLLDRSSKRNPEEIKNAGSKALITNNTLEIDNVVVNNIVNGEIIGAFASAYDNEINNNKVVINNSNITLENRTDRSKVNIYGGYIARGLVNDDGDISGGSITNNLVEINNTNIGEGTDTAINIYTGYFDNYIEGLSNPAAWNGKVKENTLVIKGTSNIEKANLYGYGVTNADTINVEANNNKLVLDNWAGKVNSVNNFNSIEFKNIKDEADVILNPTQTLDLADMTVSVSTEGLDLSENSQHTLIQNMKNTDLATMDIKDGETVEETDNGVRVHELSHEISDTKDKLLLNVGKSVLAGNYMDDSGKSYGNNVLNINEGFHTNAGVVAGSYATGSSAAQGGKVVISGDFTGKTDSIYAGYSENGTVNNNDIELQQTANVENLALYGANKAGSNNTLNVDGWQGNVRNIGNFNTVNFTNLAWQPNNAQAVINITGTEKTDLSNTKVNVEKIALAGGQTINAGQSMKLISGSQIDNFAQGTVKTTAGVTTDVEAQVAGDGKNVAMTVTSVGANEQTDLVAENRAVAAAFLNQGGDLISDGLDSLTDQYGYGMKTFAAVYGNRSTYDVNSDLKINGWSEIIGIGEKKRFNDSDFAYGVFYENGSGNYRTYNEFNNEFFRGDGDLVYNGGGIAARLSKDNGMYFEGSLRAGTLKSEMSNALKDGSGNSYGYENDSTYYGAHVGVGRVLKLDENRDLDIYGKFFHTYIDGDNFTVSGDRFSFDSVTSDRLRIGAQLTTNKNNKWSTHYGLAYEYEFNGDSDMKAGQFDLPTQSLEGGTIIGEIGLTYQGSEFSPWSLDLNLRGYEGQREGFSGHVQATYTF